MKVHLGQYSYITGNKVDGTFSTDELHIGKWCSIASGLKCMLGGNHPMDLISTFDFAREGPSVFKDLPWPHPIEGYSKGNIIIENDVWIGQNVTILSGVHIGNGAIIGTTATVTKDIPDYAIVAGNPAKIKKYRFSEEIINKLLKIKWWDWPLEKIREAYPIFTNPDINLFLNTYGGDK